MAKPGLIRVVVGTALLFGAAGALDQVALAQAPASTALLLASSVLIWRGARRMERGVEVPTPQPVLVPAAPVVAAPQPVPAPRPSAGRLFPLPVHA